MLAAKRNNSRKSALTRRYEFLWPAIVQADRQEDRETERRQRDEVVLIEARQGCERSYLDKIKVTLRNIRAMYEQYLRLYPNSSKD